MECEKNEEYIADFVDGELQGKQRLDLASHLHACQKCQLKLEDLLKLRASIQFSKAIDPAPVADNHFPKSILNCLEEKSISFQQPDLTGFSEKIKLALMPLNFRWLAPAAALVFLFLFPISMLENSNNGNKFSVPATLTVAQNNKPEFSKKLHTQKKEETLTELEEYLISHSQYAADSQIAYPVTYASY